MIILSTFRSVLGHLRNYANYVELCGLHNSPLIYVAKSLDLGISALFPFLLALPEVLELAGSNTAQILGQFFF